ncbi:ribonuclease Oy-like [Lytechinus variegatus]|uniref:ribonuclease Oy-like n=1 Tax=Lytechinus variegatus TaxID=7654 RepID=UPI001BB1E1F0|nr:ribonuclease Oy-like [Lytechinus variegatus]
MTLATLPYIGIEPLLSYHLFLFYTQDCREYNVKNNWTIHGLWPSQGSSQSPTYCNNSWPFDPQAVKDLRITMSKTWSTLDKRKTNEEFWAYEWVKHGTCAAQGKIASLHTQHGFFALALELNSAVNIYRLLARDNIRPSKVLFYPSASVRSAIQRGLGHSIGMYCVDQSSNLLMEVRICYGLSFKVIECKEIFGQQCDPKRKIMIPPKT